jgi:hypothetical protein
VVQGLQTTPWILQLEGPSKAPIIGREPCPVALDTNQMHQYFPWFANLWPIQSMMLLLLLSWFNMSV